MRAVRTPLAAAVMLVAGLSAPNAAQGPTPNVNDGNALLRECGTALRAADDGPVLEENPVERGVAMGQCLGVVAAVWHTHKLMVDAYDSRRAFCPATSLSAGQMARLVHTYLSQHVSELDHWDTELTLEAFVDAYPCG